MLMAAGLSLGGGLYSGDANADCSTLQKIRAAADNHFRSVQGQRKGILDDPDEDDLVSTLTVEGAQCTISPVGDSSKTHSCTWVLSQDRTRAAAIFEDMVTEVAACVLSHDPPERSSHDRNVTVSFVDGRNRSAMVRFHFRSGWYLVDLDYEVDDH
jgi:hypothetical protein